MPAEIAQLRAPTTRVSACLHQSIDRPGGMRDRTEQNWRRFNAGASMLILSQVPSHKHYAEQARAIRVLAATVVHPEARQQLELVASLYDRLAHFPDDPAEQRGANDSGSTPSPRAGDAGTVIS